MPSVDNARAALPLWLASVPDPITPSTGRDAAQRALDDAAAVLQNIKLRFSGTLPPSPWPASPDVEKARADVEIARDAFDALDSHTDDGRIKLSWAKGSGKFGPALVRAGTALYTSLAALEEHAATSESLPDFTAKLAALGRPLVGVTAIAALGLAYLAYKEFRSVRRLIEGY